MQTVAFYEQNAESFYESTVSIDAQALYDEFLPLLPENAHILDAGCGSGRDTLSFLRKRYQVTAFDGSPELAALASELTGISVETSLFLDFQTEALFDGIWACASLLHVPKNQLAETFTHLASFLKDSGYFYCSFKYGAGECERDGRHFTNLDEQGLASILIETALEIEKSWVTHDLRPGREHERWLNAILKKA